MPMLFYTPEAAQLQTQSRQNNQGAQRADGRRRRPRRGTPALGIDPPREHRDLPAWLTGNGSRLSAARIDLPLSTYTQWYWKIDLHNLLHFLTLRVDAHAQWEIQEFGRVMAGMLKRVAPLSYEAWIDYDVCGTHVSRGELESLRALVKVENDGLTSVSKVRLDRAALGERNLSKREIDEGSSPSWRRRRPSPRLQPLTPPTLRPAEHFAQRFAEAVPATGRTRADRESNAAGVVRQRSKAPRRERVLSDEPCRRRTQTATSAATIATETHCAVERPSARPRSGSPRRNSMAKRPTA